MDIWIRIRSLFEKKGVEDAAKGASELEMQTKKTGETSASASKQVQSAASVMQQLGVSSGGAAGKVAALVGQMGTLGPLAAGAAGIAVFKEVVGLIAEASEAQRAFLQEQSNIEAENAIQRLVDGYALLRDQINEAKAARAMLSAAELEAERAKTAFDIARMEREREEEKAKLAPDDEIGRRKIDAAYGTRIAAAQEGQKAAEGRRAVDELMMEAAEAAARFEEASLVFEQTGRMLQESFGKVAELNAAAAALRAAHAEDVRRTALGGGEGGLLAGPFVALGMAVAKPKIKEAEQLEEQARKLVNQDKEGNTVGVMVGQLSEHSAARQERDAASVAMQALNSRMEAARLAEAADAERRKTREAQERQAQASIHAAERDRALRSEEDRIRGMREPTQSRVSREQADVATARERLSKAKGGYGEESARKNLEKQIKELEEARAADARVFAQVTRMLEQLNRQKQAQEAQIKRI